MNQLPNRKPIKEGGQAYIILCYAKMKKGWITRADYRAFQLNRKDLINHVEESFKHLAKSKCLEQVGPKGQERYRITLYGEHVLQLTGQHRKKREHDEMNARMTANGYKSKFTTESRLLDKLKRNGGDPVI
jgi:hypothetical protein